MRAFIIRRRRVPANLGHIGWGYEQPDGTIICGATENPHGYPVIMPNDDNGFWTTTLPDEPSMKARFKGRGYDDYKQLEVSRCDLAKARQAAYDSQHAGYTVVGNNCMDQAARIIAAYGGDLPAPFEHWEPNDWFEAIPTPSLAL